ncbi:hypothetical protein [Nitratireductor alexandrii]|uniref:hypothetical protein n=1 Tax=Nitratireductor alexandrii TaxID=2448161 RepID=UPI001EE7BD6E|nr:hypothetical protein [Nitratireductor alexandrii]
MLRSITRIILAALISTLPILGGANRAAAQSYPIDCAILLCLSGGWPASVPCARARAEFIRRITPWPVEPPLQIWRCPMGASYHPSGDGGHGGRLYDILFDNAPLPQSLPESRPSIGSEATPAILTLDADRRRNLPNGLALHLAQDRADIDISGPEFNFVRSIRVYDVRYARQHESGRDGDCNRSATVRLGTYGVQGDFAWAPTSLTALPEAHVGLERWGEHCPGIFHRSVFVDWRDYEGNYGYEQVNY